MDKTPIFHCSIETRQLADFLQKQAEANDTATVITYAELSKAAGVNVLEKRNVLQTARNIVLRESRKLYGTVAKEGVKLCTSAEASACGESGRRSITKTATRFIKRMGATEYDDLTEEQKVSHNANASLLGAVRVMNQRSMRARLAGAVAQAQDRISMKTVMRLFGTSDNGTT